MVEPLVIDHCDVNGVHTIGVAGEVDIATAAQLAAVLEQCDGSCVCVDLAGVTYMDSSGLALLVAASRSAAEREAEFTVRNVAPHVQRTFELTGIEHLLSVEPLPVTTTRSSPGA